MPMLGMCWTRSSRVSTSGMADLRVSVQARRDLEQIGDVGVKEHGAIASARHLEGFGRLFRLLREQPLAGRNRSELGLGIRSLSHRPHTILYRVEGDMVVIDRTIHQARDVGRISQGDH